MKVTGIIAGTLIALLGETWNIRRLLLLCVGAIVLLLVILHVNDRLPKIAPDRDAATPTSTMREPASQAGDSALGDAPDKMAYERFLLGLGPGTCITMPEPAWYSAQDDGVPSSYSVVDCAQIDAVFMIDVVGGKSPSTSICSGKAFHFSLTVVDSGTVCGHTVIQTGFCFSAALAPETGGLSVEFNHRVSCQSPDGVAGVANVTPDGPACAAPLSQNPSNSSSYFGAYLEEWAVFVCVTQGPAPG